LAFTGDARYVPIQSELLTTAQAAVLLGSSRQHVVDLCERGELPYIRVGTHRRLHRSDVEAMLRPGLSRDQLKALWLHRAVAGRLVRNPDRVLAKARTNLAHLRTVHPRGMAARWLERWQVVLDSGTEAVHDALTSPAPLAIELRQNSPFAGVLSEGERRDVLAAFARRWREEYAA
jgi:excisionase family DNA binding protein